jgi:uncharacterized protein (TIRG00374 family)
MKTKNIFKAALGIVISAVLIWYAVRGVSLDELLDTVSEANYFYVLPALCLTILFYWLRAIRWRYMLVPIKPVKTSQLFAVTVIGFMVNNILPVRIGEVVRAYILGSRENLSKSLSLATIVVERILDGLTILAFLIPGLLLFSFPPLVKSAATALLLFYASLIMFLFLLTFYSAWVTRVVRRFVSPLSEKIADRLIMMLGSFCEGLRIFKTGPQIFWIFVYTLFIWVTASLIVMMFLYAFHFSVPLYAAFILLAIIAVGVALPAAPGFVGPLQMACIIGLAIFDIEKSDALGFSIVYHASQYFPVTLLGFYFMWRSHLHLKDITEKTDV